MLNRTEKLWGYELEIVNDKKNNYCGKKLFFLKNHWLSWHYHNEKTESFYCTGKLLVVYSQHDCIYDGKIHVAYYSESMLPSEFPEDMVWRQVHTIPADSKLKWASVVRLDPGDVFHVPIGLRHRMIALLDTDLFEFSTFHRDEDSIRLLKGK